MRNRRRKACSCANASDALKEALGGIENIQCVQNRFDFRDFVGPEEIGLSERGKEGEERFGGTHFVAEKFEGVRQCVADGESERAESKSVKKNGHLMADTNGAVLKVAVIETEAGIEEDFVDAGAGRDFDLAGEVIAHYGDGIGAEIEVTDLADVFSLDVTNDYSGIMGSGHAEEFISVFSGSEIKNLRTGFETCTGNGGLIGFHRDQEARFAERFDEREEFAGLSVFIETSGMGQRRFRAGVDDVGPLLFQNFAAANCGFSGKANAFAIPGICRKVDNTHDGRLRIEPELAFADGKFAHLRLRRGAISFQKAGQIFEA